MKNVETFGFEALSAAKMQQTKGGTDSNSSFWQRAADIAASVVLGLVEFGKSGGRNVGLTVK